MVQRTRRVSKRATSRRLNGSRSLKVSKRIKKSRRRQTRKLKTRRPIVRKRVKKTRKQTRKSRKTKKKSRNSLPPIIKSFEYRLKLLNKLKRNRKKMMKGGAGKTSDLLNNLKLLVKILGGAPIPPPPPQLPQTIAGQDVQVVQDDPSDIDIDMLSDFDPDGVFSVDNLVKITETCVKFGLSLHGVVKDIMEDIENERFATGSSQPFGQRDYGPETDQDIRNQNAGNLLDSVIEEIEKYIEVDDNGNTGELQKFRLFCKELCQPFLGTDPANQVQYIKVLQTGENGFPMPSKYAQELAKSGTLLKLSRYSLSGNSLPENIVNQALGGHTDYQPSTETVDNATLNGELNNTDVLTNNLELIKNMKNFNSALPELHVEGVAKYLKGENDRLSQVRTGISESNSDEYKKTFVLGFYLNSSLTVPIIFEVNDQNQIQKAPFELGTNEAPNFDVVTNLRIYKLYSVKGVNVFRVICKCLANTHNFLYRGLTDLKSSIGTLKTKVVPGAGRGEAKVNETRIDGIEPQKGFAGEQGIRVLNRDNKFEQLQTTSSPQ